MNLLNEIRLKDKDFELLSESAAARVALLTNEGYFNRHRELAAEHGVTEAWRMVEAELPFGLSRFTCFHAFEKARKMESQGRIGTPRLTGQNNS